MSQLPAILHLADALQLQPASNQGNARHDLVAVAPLRSISIYNQAASVNAMVFI